MSGCGRTFCSGCDQEMIHRDNRKSYESASAFGQVVWRLQKRGYRGFTIGDVDMYVRRYARGAGRTLLRLVEQKNPRHKFEGAQRLALHDLDVIIRHAVDCKPHGLADDTVLDPGSGVYIVRATVGELPGSKDRRTGFPPDLDGLEQLVTVEAMDGKEVLAARPAEVLEWLVDMPGMAAIRWDAQRKLFVPGKVA